jgi:hypothetical protein
MVEQRRSQNISPLPSPRKCPGNYTDGQIIPLGYKRIGTLFGAILGSSPIRYLEIPLKVVKLLRHVY